MARLRLADADCLYNARTPDRLLGAVYLAGLALDCVLKARLLEAFPWAATDPISLSGANRRVRNLIFRGHDLEAMAARVPGLYRELQNESPEAGARRDTILKRACAAWTIDTRYATTPVDAADAEQFLDDVKDLLTWL